MKKLPFYPGIFFKTLLVVVILVTVVWSLYLWLSDYIVTPADYIGTFISTILLTYLVHLWIMPTDHSLFEDESDSDEE